MEQRPISRSDYLSMLCPLWIASVDMIVTYLMCRNRINIACSISSIPERALMNLTSGHRKKDMCYTALFTEDGPNSIP